MPQAARFSAAVAGAVGMPQEEGMNGHQSVAHMVSRGVLNGALPSTPCPASTGGTCCYRALCWEPTAQDAIAPHAEPIMTARATNRKLQGWATLTPLPACRCRKQLTRACPAYRVCRQSKQAELGG